MGCESTIAHDRFPAQGSMVGKRVEVCFHYDAGHLVAGRIRRDDIDAPHRMIIELEDGRLVLGTECQWTPAELASHA